MADALQRMAHMILPRTVVRGAPERGDGVPELERMLPCFKQFVTERPMVSELGVQRFVHLTGIFQSTRETRLTNETDHAQRNLVPIGAPGTRVALTELDHLRAIIYTTDFGSNVRTVW